MVLYRFCDDIQIELKGEILYKEISEFQAIVVLEHKILGKVLLIGDKEEDLTIQLSEKDEAYYHEAVVHPVMAMHPNPKNILIIGGGDGGTAREVLKHNPDKVTLVDIDKKVIEICKKYIPIDNGALDDLRVKVIIEDGKKFIEETNEKFDVVIVDLTDPEEPSKLLFTKEFYQEIKKHLTENGTVSGQASDPLVDPQVLGRIHAALKEVFTNIIAYGNYVPSYFVEEVYCISTDSEIKDISQVLKERKIKLDVFTPEQLENMLKLPSKMVREILAKEWKPSTIDDPVVHV